MERLVPFLQVDTVDYGKSHGVDDIYRVVGASYAVNSSHPFHVSPVANATVEAFRERYSLVYLRVYGQVSDLYCMSRLIFPQHHALVSKCGRVSIS